VNCSIDGQKRDIEYTVGKLDEILGWKYWWNKLNRELGLGWLQEWLKSKLGGKTVA